MFSTLLARLRSCAGTSGLVLKGPVRVELCAPESLQSQRPDVAPLYTVQLEFMGALRGIRTEQVDELIRRIGHARSLHDLWRMRAEVFEQIANEFGKSEARSRMTFLQRHFPTQAPTAGSGAPKPPRHAGMEP